MNSKKLEMLLILILVLLNLFLLTVVLSDTLADRRARQHSSEMLLDMLTSRGISVDPEVELLQPALPQFAVARSAEQEERWVQAFLGEHSTEDQGGGILYYRSDAGQLVMRGTGELNMMLTEWAPGMSPQAAAEALFHKAGLELAPVGPAESEGDNTLQWCCGWKGYPVYNAVLSFDFFTGNMTIVSGTMVFSREVSTETEGIMDSVSALTAFASLTKDEGIIATRLTALEPGYYMRVTMSGESLLTPVWHIVTDTADIYLNAVTGLPENRPAVS